MVLYSPHQEIKILELVAGASKVLYDPEYTSLEDMPHVIVEGCKQNLKHGEKEWYDGLFNLSRLKKSPINCLALAEAAFTALNLEWQCIIASPDDQLLPYVVKTRERYIQRARDELLKDLAQGQLCDGTYQHITLPVYRLRRDSGKQAEIKGDAVVMIAARKHLASNEFWWNDLLISRNDGSEFCSEVYGFYEFNNGSAGYRRALDKLFA